MTSENFSYSASPFYMAPIKNISHISEAEEMEGVLKANKPRDKTGQGGQSQ